ncbi:AAA domain-containing protein [Oceanobacillus sojae]|uniref:AAA domain-containing protein n=1 Tax=Oceanobacillus sojae TaxID=582851 RepID=UPI0021A782D3|nr:AAA domain-containing protein [Oceanobacillus sojae]MCT1904977.1 AAA domain-containing protein [Oceanobacillus sojae]
MVTIFMKGQNKTNQIIDWRLWYKEMDKKVMLSVKFPSGKEFTLPMEECSITPQEKLTGTLLCRVQNIYQNIESAVEYGDKYVIIKYPTSEKPYIMKSADIEISSESNFKNEDVFSYFLNVTKERVKNADQKNKPIAQNILRQLEKVTPHSETALHAYCYGQNSTRTALEHLIFPFGLNESQFQAVKNAFSSQISIIEGPPGTGKTQTILNIISNILVNQKTVAVVSNNNTAVENVYEKMAKDDLEYLVAKLGNSDNKDAFFANIGKPPSAKTANETIQIEAIDNMLEKIKRHLKTKNTASQLIAEINELSIEKQYLEEWLKKNTSVELKDLGKYKLRPQKITDLMAYINTLLKERVSFKNKCRLLLEFKIIRTRFLSNYSERINFIYSLQFAYYDKMLQQKEQQLNECEEELKESGFQNLLEELTVNSMKYLKNQLAETILSSTEPFTTKSYKNRKEFSKFIKRFPVIGSSTHSIVNSIADGAVLDYIIIDEASQQDIVPGILSLGCAKNVIVVGDRKQLPHIPEKAEVSCPAEYYDCGKYSLLDSFVELFKEEVPSTMLKEHYRCHPRIIQFCNQQFYDNQLIPMTHDNGESSIELIITSKGTHTRNLTNLRELESILEIGWSDKDNVGFIAPYRKQVNLSEKYFPQEITKDTTHKFQGRECKEIIFSTVLDKKKDSQKHMSFVDNPSLINVAVSRAINKFTLVTGNEVFTKNNQSIAALTRYIKYYAKSEHIYDSPVVSAFDLLYDEYDKSLDELNARLDYSDPQKKSEKIVRLLLKDILNQDNFKLLKFHMQVDLIQLVSIVNNSFTPREKEFMQQKSSCDFVIYYKVGKAPLGVIEVDGGSHDEPVQIERDTQKNAILNRVNIPILRLKTVEGHIEEKMKDFLSRCMKGELKETD